MEDERETAYLRQQRRNKLSLSCCLGHGDPSTYNPGAASPSVGKLSPIISPSSWFRSKGGCCGSDGAGDFPEIKPGRCRRSGNIIPRIGGRHARRRHSADFSYDPLSYALNFDDGSGAATEESPVEEFSARLPVSPPRRRLRDLELPSPRRSPATATTNSAEMPSPAIVERPRTVMRQISMEPCYDVRM